MQRIAAGFNGGGGGGSDANYEFLLEFTVGEPGAPTDGSTFYGNSLINGDIKLFKNGVGYLKNTQDDPSEPGFIVETGTPPGPGITLTGGLIFSEGETYSVFKVIQ